MEKNIKQNKEQIYSHCGDVGSSDPACNHNDHIQKRCSKVARHCQMGTLDRCPSKQRRLDKNIHSHHRMVCCTKTDPGPIKP